MGARKQDLPIQAVIYKGTVMHHAAVLPIHMLEVLSVALAVSCQLHNCTVPNLPCCSPSYASPNFLLLPPPSLLLTLPTLPHLAPLPFPLTCWAGI